jgi:hypothetical protein
MLMVVIAEDDLMIADSERGSFPQCVVWTYETPFKAMEQIKDYVAFHPDRVDAIGSHGAKALIPPDKETGK